MRVKKWVLISTIMVIMAMTGCQSSVIPSQPTSFSQPLATPTLTVTPTLSITASPTATNEYPPTPVPTISLATQHKIVELLDTKNCILPCYLGITPGVTTWSDAKKLLDSTGAIYLGPGKTDELVTSYAYGMYGNGSLNALNQPTESLFEFILWVDHKGIVQKTFANFVAQDGGHILPEYWAENSPANIFLQLGKPDALYSAAGGLALIYHNRGVIGLYDSLWNQNSLCPGNEIGLSILRIILTNTKFPLDLYSPEPNVEQEPSIWLPIEQTLNMSIQQFYEKVLSDPSVCFEIKP